MPDEKILDLKESTLKIEGTPEEQLEWSKRVETRLTSLQRDQSERKQVYRVRKDFFIGDQGQYSNVVGMIKKEKKGHNNAVINYAGKTGIKIIYGLANNPPKLNVPSLDPLDDIENSHAQGTEDFINSILEDRDNRFWKKTYRRAVHNQVVVGDAALKIYPCPDKKGGYKIKIVNHENMDNLLVGWRGDDPSEFDFVIADVQRTAQSVYDEFGIKVNDKYVNKIDRSSNYTGSHDSNNQWGTKNVGRAGRAFLPSGKTDLPTVRVVEYDDENVYALKIQGELAQLIFKDDVNYPKIKFWTIVKNMPSPISPWSQSDIDFLIDAQVEYNDITNHAKDYIRVGATQRYVAYNVSDFDPESITTRSGQVIFIDSPDGSSRLEPLPTNVNNFPADQYLNKIQGAIYDMGLPRVTYGVSGQDSGRSKAIDYQSMVDLLIFKRDSWELALQEICEKIQILGNFLYRPKFLEDSSGDFVVRDTEFDWNEMLPLTQSDKIVNVVNKLNAGLPFSEFFKELGYRNVDQIIQSMKKEAQDPDMMIFRSKMWQLTKGIIGAQEDASVSTAGMGESPNPNQPQPTLTTEGRDSNLPMAAASGTTAYSTPKGQIEKARQNLMAAGR